MLGAYGLRARLAPVGLAALPALVLFGGGLTSPSDAASVVGMALGGVGIVAAGLARDAGRDLQAQLWRSWGGSPTVQRLRWRSNPDREKLARRHAAVSEIAGFSLPTADAEAADPSAADARYEEATALLRGLTRDRGAFPLVSAENVEYGFRRNCLGLREVGLTVALGASIAGAVLATVVGVKFLIATGLAVGATIWWHRVVSSEWVRRAGDLYADELMNSVEILRRSESGHVGTKR